MGAATAMSPIAAGGTSPLPTGDMFCVAATGDVPRVTTGDMSRV